MTSIPNPTLALIPMLDAFRALQTRDSVTPSTLASLLQSIIAEISAAINAVGDNVTANHTNLTWVQGQADALSERATDIETEISNLSSTTDDLNRATSTNAHNIESLRASISSLQTAVSALQTTVADLKTKVYATVDSVGPIDTIDPLGPIRSPDNPA